ncbi:MAG: hypothetical protein ABJD53_06940 [Gammaproteobacteria bacterium]
MGAKIGSVWVFDMSLLIRINLSLVAVFVLGPLIAGHVCWNILEANAQREVFAEAGLMMGSALATRAFMFLPLGVFAAVFVVVNGVLCLMMVRPIRPIRPIRQIARVADHFSLGIVPPQTFPQRGAPDIISLARSFNRMRKNLEKALRLIEK